MADFVFDKIRKVKMSILYDNKIRIFLVALFLGKNFPGKLAKNSDGNFCYQ